MRLAFFIILSLFFTFFTPKVFAQDTGWNIDLYESEIHILENGSVTVEERVEVDYDILQKHGIFKDIPYVYDLNGEKYYTIVQVDSVSRDGTVENYTSYKNGNNIQVKIGDPDKTVSGKHNYSIKYIVQGVILPYAQFDELYWNVTGEWPVPIDRVNAYVYLPKDSILQAVCYVGYFGSDKACNSETSSKSALLSAENLLPGEQMTVAVGFKKGTVPLITVPKPKSFFEKATEPFNLFLFFLPIFGGAILVLYFWYSKGRDLWSKGKYLFDPSAKAQVKPIGSHDQIVVEYAPPENLRPAELGVLMDERADTLDVTATIIDLAARGYFSIVEIPKKWIFGSVDYQLNKKKDPDASLLSYEKTLMNRLFEDLKMIKTSELKNKFYSDLSKVKKELYAHVVDKKLFPSNPEKVREKYIFIGIAIFIGSILGVIFIQIVSLQMFLAGNVIFSLYIIIFSRSMPKRSAYGQELYRRSRGYYEFISHVEKYRQQFFERKNMLNEVLPYAIVFGLTGKFAKALKDMGVKPEQPSWYVGHTAFNIVNFEKNVNAFSSSLSSAISSAPRSSGSSGGGFSGGGFGGGGGGSW